MLTDHLDPVLDELEEIRAFRSEIVYPGGHVEPIAVGADEVQKVHNLVRSLLPALAHLDEVYANARRRAGEPT